MKLTILFLLFAFASFGQSKNDSTISIPPTLEARMLDAEKMAAKAKEDLAKAEKELNDGMKILFEVAGKKAEDFDVVGYAPGVLKIRKKLVAKK